MSKTLVIFSDGTGNKGGVTNDTNVWRLYQMIDRNKSGQLTYYDDGVGTQNFSPVKIVSGALGWGLSRNIRQAYAFLVKNYNPGDKIYLFGFSRGAYTVRSLLEMVHACGLVNRHTGGTNNEPAVDLTTEEIDKRVRAAFKAYRSVNKEACEIHAKKYKNLKVAIEFIGVWDTVDAVGLPFNGSLAIELLYWSLFRSRAYEFRDQTINGAKVARQALAIDDERKSFHPNYWAEAGKYVSGLDSNGNPVLDDANLEQVWFTGMHSNCGGSYPKDGLAYITLEWMISEMDEAGVLARTSDPTTRGLLDLSGAEVRRVRDLANDGDKLYDSRDGIANFYRYDPRRLSKFADGTKQPIKIHVSVINRIIKRTQNYAPLFIEQANGTEFGDKIPVVYTGHEKSQFRKPKESDDEPFLQSLPAETKKHLDSLVWWREKVFYALFFLSISIAAMGLTLEPINEWGMPVTNHVVKGGHNQSGSSEESQLCYKNPTEGNRELLISLAYLGCAQVSLQAKIWNHTGIWLEKGRGYSFELDDIQNWEDDGNKSSPYVGREAEGIVNWIRFTSFDPDAKYMELLGIVDGNVFSLGRLAMHANGGFSRTFIPRTSGELIVLTNEPVWNDYFFENNSGSAELIIRSVALGEFGEREAIRVLADSPNAAFNWIAATTKVFVPRMAENIIDNALSYPRMSALWLTLVILMIVFGYLFEIKIRAVARSGWDALVPQLHKLKSKGN